MMKSIKKGDQVRIIAGKDKGKDGEVLRVLDSKVLVKGLNKVKKSQKPDPNRGIKGGIIEKEMPLHVSNVAILNGKKTDRVGVKVLKDGRKVRVFKSNGETIDA